MSAASKEQDASQVNLGVLAYREGKDWVALALEMDLRGYGKTIDEAVRELSDLVAMQLSFARLKSQPELVWKPAEPQYWTLFTNAKRDQLLRSAAGSTKRRNPDIEARALDVPPPPLTAGHPEFQQANA